MFEKVYLQGFDEIKNGSICYGSKGEPLSYLDRDGDLIKLVKPDGEVVTTDISSIKLLQPKYYRSFRWKNPPGERIASASNKGYKYHPRQLLAIGEWSDPVTEIDSTGETVNKRIDTGSGVRKPIPNLQPVIWVDSSKLDLSYQPDPTEQIDDLPIEIKSYADTTRQYLDIETTGLDPAIYRVIMFGVRNDRGEDAIFTNPDEKLLLIDAIVYIRANRPDLMFFHNGYAFDIPFIITRCELHGISHPFRALFKPTQRMIKSTAHGVLKKVFVTDIETPEYGGKMTTYEAFDGDTIIIDTMVAIGLWDSSKKLPNLKLKPTVINLKLRDDTRLELTNDEIQSCWVSGNLDRLREYLIFDLEDTQLLADKIMPSIWYQQAYLPTVSLMDLVHKNTGFKIQQMYTHLCPEPSTSPDRSQISDIKHDYGGGLTGAIRGVFRDVSKIDVTSLYPSLMVRYRLGSRKDPNGRYISVLSKMLTDRIAYKRAGKDGDLIAAGMAEAIKLLMNSGYGFLGTQGYSFNDMENAAIVTAYGQAILRLMCTTIEANDGVLISADTDGVYFSHTEPDLIFNLVADVLPDGINIELEKRDLKMFSLAKKNYCLYGGDGSVDIKGNSLLSNTTPIELEFIKTYPLILIESGQVLADKYYSALISELINSSRPISDVAITGRLLPHWKKKMDLLGMSEPAIATYYYSRSDNHPQWRHYTRQRLYQELETSIEHYPTVPYFGEYYAYLIEHLRSSMLNLPEPKERYKVKIKAAKYPGQLCLI
jgi:DNA polymerase elongation subunit (family B)